MTAFFLDRTYKEKNNKAIIIMVTVKIYLNLLC